MKLFILLVVCVVGINADACMKSHLKCFDERVNDLLNTQIQLELKAQLTYLTLAQNFDSYKTFYPKIAKFLRDKSAEELSHAERFMEYQNQRGGTVSLDSVSVYNECSDTGDLKGAFQCALKLERHVTAKLTELHYKVQEVSKKDGCTDSLLKGDDLRLGQPIIIKKSNGEQATIDTEDGSFCNSFVTLNYVELAEMIAHEFLGHQVADTKELANMMKTLERIADGDSDSQKLAKYLFDKEL